VAVGVILAHGGRVRLHRRGARDGGYTCVGFTITIPLYKDPRAGTRASVAEYQNVAAESNTLSRALMSVSPTPAQYVHLPDPVSAERLAIESSPFLEEEEEEPGCAGEADAGGDSSDRMGGGRLVHPDVSDPRAENVTSGDGEKRRKGRVLNRQAARRAVRGPTSVVASDGSGIGQRGEAEVSSGYVSGVMSSLKVLVVDDAALNRKMLRRLMRQSTSEVEEACDGREAVVKVQKAQEQQLPYDLILMDFQMPVMTGPEAAYQMRKDGFKGWIIGVTGNALDVDLEHFISQGADRVLTKPVSLRSLRSIIAGGSPVGRRRDACVAEL